MLKTLKGRLTLWYTLLFIFMALSIFLYIHTMLSLDLNRRIDEELVDDAKEILQIFENAGIHAAAEEILLEVEGDDRKTNFYRIFSTEHELLAATDLQYWKNLAKRPEIFPAPGEISYESLFVAGHEFKVRSVYYGLQNGGTLQVGFESVENGNLFKLFYETFGIAFVTLLSIGTVLGFLIAKRAMKGLDRLKSSVEKVGRGELFQAVNIGSEGVEVETLILSFNQAQNRIQSLVGELCDVSDNIAHDLRSPVTRIRGIAETSLTGQQSLSGYQGSLGDIIEDCDTLISMINTMLEIAQSDAGTIKIEFAPVDISQMIHDVADIFHPLAEEKNIRLSVELPPEHLHVTGDRNRLQRALANLLDNALKYTLREGEVTLSASMDDSQVCLSVHDTGVGIAKEDREKLFTRFFRADPSRTTPGNGLGLSLVKSLVSLHHGRVLVTSALGEGSCFKIILPSKIQ